MKFFIVDSRMMLAELLSNTLKNIYQTDEVYCFNSGQLAINLIETLDDESMPDVIISDLLLPDLSGIELIEQYVLLKKKIRSNKLKTIVISSIDDHDIIRELIYTGAEGFLYHNASLTELETCISIVLDGKTYISDSIRQQINLTDDTHYKKSSYTLSPREKDLLKSICKGRTIPEAADELNISINTAKSYYKNIMKKFKVNRTPEVVMLAIKKGIFIP